MTKTFGKTRAISIKAALEWAFGVEYASLDFDDLMPEGARPGTSTIWRMMQQGQLGCKIDGGGHSRAADDAEVVANAVADLPAALGGRSMAVEIARLARAGMSPSWLTEHDRRCVAMDWRRTKHGTFAKTEVVGKGVVAHRGRAVRYDVICCPVDFLPTAQQVAVSHRRYLDWYGCLMHLRAELRSQCLLTTILLTDAMPPMKPWQAVSKKVHNAA